MPKPQWECSRDIVPGRDNKRYTITSDMVHESPPVICDLCSESEVDVDYRKSWNAGAFWHDPAEVRRSIFGIGLRTIDPVQACDGPMNLVTKLQQICDDLSMGMFEVVCLLFSCFVLKVLQGVTRQTDCAGGHWTIRTIRGVTAEMALTALASHEGAMLYIMRSAARWTKEGESWKET